MLVRKSQSEEKRREATSEKVPSETRLAQNPCILVPNGSIGQMGQQLAVPALIDGQRPRHHDVGKGKLWRCSMCLRENPWVLRCFGAGLLV